MAPVDYQDRVVLITGAVQGIGRAIALELASEGCRGMCVIDLKRGSAGEQLEQELSAAGCEGEHVQGDVADAEVVQHAVSRALERWGRLDVIVNNAGMAKLSDLFSTPDDQWDLVLRVNLRSVFLTMKYGGMAMRDQGGGVIVNMSSIAGVTGGSTGPDYGASKAGVIALTKFGAKTLGPLGIRVNAVAPGTIETEMIRENYAKLSPDQVKRRLSAIPMGRMGLPSEVARAVAFLASSKSSYINGDVLCVTGGRS